MRNNNTKKENVYVSAYNGNVLKHITWRCTWFRLHKSGEGHAIMCANILSMNWSLFWVLFLFILCYAAFCYIYSEYQSFVVIKTFEWTDTIYTFAIHLPIDDWYLAENTKPLRNWNWKSLIISIIIIVNWMIFFWWKNYQIHLGKFELCWCFCGQNCRRTRSLRCGVRLPGKTSANER